MCDEGHACKSNFIILSVSECYSLGENINPRAVSQHHALTIPVLMFSLMNKHISGPEDRPFIFDVLSPASLLLVIFTLILVLLLWPSSPLGDCFTGA